MNDDYIKLTLGSVIEKFAEFGTPGNRINMGRFAFFAIYTDWLPASVFAQFFKESLLSIKTVTFYLGNIGDPNVTNSSH
jgi:hypothetical protein